MIAPGGSGRVLLRGLAVMVLAAASVLGSAGAAPVLAAEDELSLVSKSSYALLPDKGLVHVTIDVTATNNKPNTATTRYFYDAAQIAIHAEATAVRASVGKTKVVTRVTAEVGYSILRVAFPRDLFYKQSTKFRVDYDLPGGAPRSDSDIRVGSAFATFYAWAFGDRGDVRIVIPAGYEVETTGSPVDKSVDGGVTVLAVQGVGDPAEWFSVVVANRHDALTQDRLDLDGGEQLVVRAWPEDAEWRTRVKDLLRLGLPVLVEKIGLDWPVEGEIEVSEVHTPLLEGYAGVFYTNENRIEISEDLDELTIIHEASHAWFNSALFVGRWINEGFADEYAARVLDEVSDGGLRPDALSPTSEGAVDLNEWTHPGRIDDEDTNLREHFGYEASWTVVRALLDEIGEDSMREVLAAANANETAYVGAPDPEKVTIKNDWRRFLDVLQQRGDSAQAEDLFRRWIVTTEQAALLDARTEARSGYAALLDAGKGWLPGYVVRDPMGRWEFARATRSMADATEILALRDQIAARAAALEVAAPGSLRAAYEGATDELGTVRELAAAQLATATAIEAAAALVAAERDVFTSIGLIGEDPTTSLATASAAFSAGQTTEANAGAASVESLVTSAADSGKTRALFAGLAGAGVLAGAGGAVAMRRRRRQPFVGPVMISEAATAPVDTVQPSARVHDRAESAAHRTSDLLVRFRARPGDDAPLAVSPNATEPYVTLGHPPAPEAGGGETSAHGPAQPERDGGDET